MFWAKFDKTAILKTEKSRHPQNILAFSLELQLYNGLSTKSFMFVQKFLKVGNHLALTLSKYVHQCFFKCQLYLPKVPTLFSLVSDDISHTIYTNNGFTVTFLHPKIHRQLLCCILGYPYFVSKYFAKQMLANIHLTYHFAYLVSLNAKDRQVGFSSAVQQTLCY